MKDRLQDMIDGFTAQRDALERERKFYGKGSTNKAVEQIQCEIDGLEDAIEQCKRDLAA